jgi:UDP-N-acetylmuramoyl-tripeptide--D-alanyl-D-alanine ligase
MFGAAGTADYQMITATLVHEATVVQARRRGEAVLFKVSSPGRHFAMNALGALAVAEALGADPTIAVCDVGQWHPPAGRGTREQVQLDRVEETHFWLIDDAFNANPASMAASLDVLIASEPEHGVGRVGGGRRIAVLGDMLELGPTEAELHANIARHPGLSAVSTIHCVGPRMQALWQVLPRAQRGEWVATAQELAPRARHLIDAGDIILVKGSKGSKVSLVVDALRKMGQGPAPTEGNL